MSPASKAFFSKLQDSAVSSHNCTQWQTCRFWARNIKADGQEAKRPNTLYSHANRHSISCLFTLRNPVNFLIKTGHFLKSNWQTLSLPPFSLPRSLSTSHARSEARNHRKRNCPPQLLKNQRSPFAEDWRMLIKGMTEQHAILVAQRIPKTSTDVRERTAWTAPTFLISGGDNQDNDSRNSRNTCCGGLEGG